MPEFLKFVILAIIQGIAEVLPISSSGHLRIFSSILNVDTNGSFLALAIFLHFGSLVAVIVYYWKDIIKIITGTWKFLFFKEKTEEDKFNAKLFLFLIIATIPAGIIGLLFSDKIDNLSLIWVFVFLFITGIIILVCKFFKRNKKLEDMKWYDALIVGIFQAVGVLPGISRSGITITGGKAVGQDDESSSKFAFLLFIPVTAGSFLLEVIKVFKGDIILESNIMWQYAIGIVVAGVVTYLSLKLLYGVIKKGKLYYFSIYCFLVAIVGIILCATNVLA